MARPPEATEPNESSVATGEVLFREYELIWGRPRGKRKPPEYYTSRANAQGQAALCLSGGGIRSAAFALGLLQVLSRKRLLTQFHYLSTVSGGGYIGSWLQRWIHEAAKPGEHEAPDGRIVRRTRPLGRREAAEQVMDWLGSEREPEQVRRLRENSNFITPRVGIGSNDTWTAIAISVRNVILNWLLFAPLLMLVALMPNMFAAGVESIRGAAHWNILVLQLLLVLVGVTIGLATTSTALLLPSYRDRRSDPRSSAGEGDKLLVRRIVWPLVAWSVFATLALSIELLDPQPVRVFTLPTSAGGVDVAIASLLGMLAGLGAAALILRGDHARTFDRDWVIWPVAILATTLWVTLGALLVDRYFPAKGSGWTPLLLTILSPLWMLTATLIGAIVFAGFRRSEGPTVKPDDDREWLARLSAVKIRPMLLWAVLAPAVLLLNRIGGWKDVDSSYVSLSSLAAIAGGLMAIFGGRSERSGGTGKAIAGRVFKIVPLSVLIGLGTFVFIVALLMLFGRLEQMLSNWIDTRYADKLIPAYGWLDAQVAIHVGIAAVLILLLIFFGRRIPVNRFSLNGLYRARLARGFLGAARRERDRMPDRFTGFDSADNIHLHRLAPRPGDRAVLYPVVNVALNVTATENLAWQERKAEPFVFSPLYCGSGMLSRHGQSPTRRTGAYIDTRVYGGREPDAAMIEAEEAGGAVDDKPCLGVTLATAMTISGAAATPNMGYYSSPATAFLMTLFNVRLGAWLPNPALAGTPGFEVRRADPANSITALLSELSGSTHDRGPDVYLSDGGHFENLALYEMIRRRCRFMLVSDAGADPAYGFKELGNAVRKVKIDFDVDIKFLPLRLAPRDDPVAPSPQLSWALGVVKYPEPNCGGFILYMKPSYFGDELPVDVVAYARGSPAFPHESTADQFFSESQFESYRRLGEHFMLGLASGATSVEELFRAAWGIQHEPAPASVAAPPAPAPAPPPAPPPAPAAPASGSPRRAKGRRRPRSG